MRPSQCVVVFLHQYSTGSLKCNGAELTFYATIVAAITAFCHVTRNKYCGYPVKGVSLVIRLSQNSRIIHSALLYCKTSRYNHIIPVNALYGKSLMHHLTISRREGTLLTDERLLLSGGWTGGIGLPGLSRRTHPCTAFQPDHKRLRAGGIRWLDARRVALLHLLTLPFGLSPSTRLRTSLRAKPLAPETTPPEELPSGDEQWLL